MTSPLLQRPGAVAAEGRDAGVAAHYGDPYREQRRLAAGDALVDLSHRPVLSVSGPDRLTWLHSLTTQHLTALAPGVHVEALVLDPHGRVEHHLRLADDGTTVLLDVEPGTAAALLAYLERMRFMLRVEVADASPSYAVVFDGTHRFVPRSFLQTYDGELAGLAAYEALRVAARRPRLGVDTDDKTIPNEVGWLVDAVHLDKGCYRGQETVARVHNLGRPPRRLALLHLDGSDSELPAVGDDVTLDGRVVGRVGTAVRHHELGPIALALLKRAVADAPAVTGAVANRPPGVTGAAPPLTGAAPPLTGAAPVLAPAAGSPASVLLAGSVPAAVEPALVDEPVSAARVSADVRRSLLRPRLPPSAHDQ